MSQPTLQIKNLKTIVMDTWLYSSSICENPSSVSSFSQLILYFQRYESLKMWSGKEIILSPIENSLHYCSQSIPKNNSKWYTLQRINYLGIDNHFSHSTSPMLCSLRGKRCMKLNTAEHRTHQG